MTSQKNIRDLGSFEDIVEQRREALGVKDGTTVKVPGFGREWEIAVPGLQDSTWNDAWSDLHIDMNDGLVAMADFRREVTEMILGDQAEDFIAECDKIGQDPSALLNDVLAKIREDSQENPTRRNSRNGRGRAKRR